MNELHWQSCEFSKIQYERKIHKNRSMLNSDMKEFNIVGETVKKHERYNWKESECDFEISQELRKIH